MRRLALTLVCLCVFAGVTFAASIAGSRIAQAQGGQAQGQTQAPQATPPCPVSTDPTFGREARNPIKVGGGAMYAAARERRYLDALRSPSGQPIAYRRTGSTMAEPNSSTILDHYEVTVPGIDGSISLYLDAYHFNEPRAPAGFDCVPFRVGPPPVDQFLASQLRARLALDTGAAAKAAPVNLDGAGTLLGFDRFTIISLHAFAAAAAGAPLDPEALPRELAQAGMVFVAAPAACGERRIAPLTIDLITAQGRPVRRAEAALTPEQIGSLLPGAELPEGAVAYQFNLAEFGANLTAQVAFDEATCDGRPTSAAVPIRFTRARPVDMTKPPVPAGMEPPGETVWLQAVVDLDGRLRQPRYMGGPEAYAEAAMAALAEWVAEPAAVNGRPVVSDTMAGVSFVPGGAAPPSAGPSPAGAPAGPAASGPAGRPRR